MSYEMNQVRVEVDAGPDSAPVDITVDVAADGSVELTNVSMGRGERPSGDQLARLLAAAEAMVEGQVVSAPKAPEQYHVEVTEYEAAEEEDATVIEPADLGDSVTFVTDEEPELTGVSSAGPVQRREPPFEPFGMGQPPLPDGVRYEVVLTEPEPREPLFASAESGESDAEGVDDDLDLDDEPTAERSYTYAQSGEGVDADPKGSGMDSGLGIETGQMAISTRRKPESLRKVYSS